MFLEVSFEEDWWCRPRRQCEEWDERWMDRQKVVFILLINTLVISDKTNNLLHFNSGTFSWQSPGQLADSTDEHGWGSSKKSFRVTSLCRAMIGIHTNIQSPNLLDISALICVNVAMKPHFYFAQLEYYHDWGCNYNFFRYFVFHLKLFLQCLHKDDLFTGLLTVVALICSFMYLNMLHTYVMYNNVSYFFIYQVPFWSRILWQLRRLSFTWELLEISPWQEGR